jgi:RNA polymerase sigma-70 factor (ECF subfamily)
MASLGPAAPSEALDSPLMDDKAAYERFVAPLEPRMMKSIWRVVRHPELAEDALQDALLTIWRRIDRVRDHPCPEALVLKIALNSACDVLRRRRRLLRREEPYPAGSDPGGEDPFARRLEGRAVEREVLAAVARLPKQQAAAVLLRIVEEQPYEDVARALDCSEATARIHVSRGRARLSRWLAPLLVRSGGQETIDERR